jgi:hypothetical protein
MGDLGRVLRQLGVPPAAAARGQKRRADENDRTEQHAAQPRAPTLHRESVPPPSFEAQREDGRNSLFVDGAPRPPEPGCRCGRRGISEREQPGSSKTQGNARPLRRVHLLERPVLAGMARLPGRRPRHRRASGARVLLPELCRTRVRHTRRLRGRGGAAAARLDGWRHTNERRRAKVPSGPLTVQQRTCTTIAAAVRGASRARRGTTGRPAPAEPRRPVRLRSGR